MMIRTINKIMEMSKSKKALPRSLVLEDFNLYMWTMRMTIHELESSNWNNKHGKLNWA